MTKRMICIPLLISAFFFVMSVSLTAAKEFPPIRSSAEEQENQPDEIACTTGDQDPLSPEEVMKETDGENTGTLTRLSDGELELLKNELSSSRYYGFARPEYSVPYDIDWNVVLYTGAGISDYSIDKHKYHFMTDMTAVRVDDLENFVNETTGTSYSETTKPLQWMYLEDEDALAHDHGDTNYSPVFPKTAWTDGSWYYIFHHSGWNTGKTMLMTAKKNENSWVFYSNVYIADESAQKGE